MKSLGLGVLVVLSCLCAVANSTETIPYAALSEPLGESAKKIKKLSRLPESPFDRQMLEGFVNSVEGTLEVGRTLALAKSIDPSILQSYLKELRNLADKKEKIDVMYRNFLLQAIEKKDTKRFESLIMVELDPIYVPRLRSDILDFYRRNFPKKSFQNLEQLDAQEKLEEKSIQMAVEQEQAYEEHLKILKRSEVMALKKHVPIGSRNSVLLSAELNAQGGYEFEVENLNPYTVTVSLDFEQLENLGSDKKFPFFIELRGKTKRKILDLKRLDTSKRCDFKSSYGWIRGSAFAKHDDNYLYRLPFSSGAMVPVSQGYHGETSHKGLSAYAVDFPVPIGTPVYAAREGIVIGSEGSNTLGGASPEYRRYANYVIVEHADGTMGNYFHLRQNGTAVVVGQKISKGDLIGYSGNTGYSSGPHLHFSVSKVDPVSMRRAMNLPVKISTAEGIVTLPRRGDRYTVQ